MADVIISRIKKNESARLEHPNKVWVFDGTLYESYTDMVGDRQCYPAEITPTPIEITLPENVKIVIE